VFGIALPPLRERREDVPLLARHFLDTRRLGRAPMALDPAALGALVRYDWPGNVRELANVLERAQILAEGGVITADDLPEGVTAAAGPAAAAPESPDDLEAIERRHVADVLGRSGGNKVRAAKALGISRRALYRLIHKYGLGEPPVTSPGEGSPPG
jgi:DNA-binding NtrC family response regulator